MTTLEPYKRDKIGSHLSYPLKFSEVATLLSPAVEQLNIQVWFCASKAPRQNEALARYEIMEAGYWHRFPDAPWHLIVRPIPRPLRAAVRTALIPVAVEHVRDWFLGRPFRTQRLCVYFSPANETIEYDPA